MEDFVAAIETWMVKRKPLAQKFDRDGLRSFVETQNAMARRLVVTTGQQSPEFWSAVAELATVAESMVVGAKTYAEGKDVTNL